MIKLPLGLNINNLIHDLRIFSWEAADIFFLYSEKIKNLTQKDQIIKSKTNEDPVTLADLRVNDLIIKRIQEKYRNVDWEILSEENVKIKGSNYDKNADWLWVLDPLDGTKDFIQGTDNYAMHLALNFREKPILGVVLIPQRDELWISNGNNVFCENREGIRKKFDIEEKSHLSQMTLVRSKNHGNEILDDLIQKLNFKKVVVMGSIGCKVASILRGESDVYITLSLPGKSAPKDWDFAAPESILKASGGAITNLNNEELKYNSDNLMHSGIIVATNNRKSHGEICSQIKEVLKKYKIFPINY